MRLEDVKPCKAHIEATGQEVSGVLGFGEINFNAGLIIEEKGRKKYKHGHTVHIPVFETSEFVKPFYDFFECPYRKNRFPSILRTKC